MVNILHPQVNMPMFLPHMLLCCRQIGTQYLIIILSEMVDNRNRSDIHQKFLIRNWQGVTLSYSELINQTSTGLALN